jgi:hypothetical protein
VSRAEPDLRVGGDLTAPTPPTDDRTARDGEPAVAFRAAHSTVLGNVIIVIGWWWPDEGSSSGLHVAYGADQLSHGRPLWSYFDHQGRGCRRFFGVGLWLALPFHSGSGAPSATNRVGLAGAHRTCRREAIASSTGSVSAAPPSGHR